ncbi:hypothetical protein Tco_0051655 [Tanacetum coccineum]
MNIDQDRQILMVDDNVGNQFRQNAVQNVGHLHGNGNVVTARAEGAYYEIKQVNVNCTLKDNLQQASTSGTRTDKAPVYDSDRSAECRTRGRIVDQHPATVEETQAAKFVRDFQSLAKEAGESLAKHKALEMEIDRLLRVVVSQDIMSIVQNPSIVDSSNLQNELDRTKERFENYKLHDTIYENAKLRAQLFDKDSEQKDTTHETSANTKFVKQSILGKPPSSPRPKLYAVTPLPKSTAFPKVGKSIALSKPVTLNSAPSSRESTVVNNERVIAPGIFRINPFKGSKERFASPKPRSPRSCLRWLPTGRMFDLKGKIIATSESVRQSDCSKSDNACTSNPQELISRRFPSSTFSMTGCQNWLNTLLIPLLSEYKPKDKENHGDNECDS